MMSNRLRMIIAAMTVVLLLTPALIWSDRHASRNAIDNNPLKLPPASTIGSEQHPYTPSRLEDEKRQRHQSFSWPPLETRGLPRLGAPTENSAYPGMTPAEREKLNRMRETIHQLTPTLPRGAADPIMTTGNVPRVPGIEGLTSRERAKLDRHIEDQN